MQIRAENEYVVYSENVNVLHITIITHFPLS